MTLSEVTALIIASTGAIGLYLSHRLGILGQRKDAQQQQAATKLQERIAAFDELEALNDRLTSENTRLNTEIVHLRSLIDEAEVRGDLRLAAQGRRCAARLADMSATLVTLQGVVLSEVAKSAAQHEVDLSDRHVADEHPNLD